MFRFESSAYLFLLWLIPLMSLVYYVYLRHRSQRLKDLGQVDLLQKLIVGWQPRMNLLKTGFLFAALGMLVLALANPQWGSKKEKVKAQSSDVFIALDISFSMLAEDISPNRLERAKKLCNSIVQGLKGNRIGLILFAGNAYLQMPLTNDYAAAQLFINSANTGQATTQGTAIAEAVQLAERAYQSDKPAQRALIIVTDGEDHDSEAIRVIKEAKENGLFVFTIGVGTKEGAVIPYFAQGQQLLKRDQDGNTVTTALNVDLVNEMARAGGGESWLIGQGTEIVTGISRRIDQIAKRDVEQRSFTEYISYFQYLLALGILFVVIELFLAEKAKQSEPRWSEQINSK